MEKSKRLYRYINLGEFIYILTNCKLTLKYPGNWEDKLEAIFLKTIASEEGCKKLIESYKAMQPTANEDDIKTQLQIITSKLLEVRCQCWTRNKDDLRMWQDRKSKEVVCIEIDEDVLIDNGIKFHDICYKNEIIAEEELRNFIDGDNWLFSLILSKKKCFEYENECRIYQGSPTSNVSGRFHYGNTVAERILINFLYAKNEIGTDPVYIDFSPKNIRSVQVHPSASNEFESVVQKLCEQYISGDIFIGRSKILD